MESVNCNFCGARDTAFLCQGYDRLHGLPGTFRLVRCRRCGLAYLDPRPGRGELDRYYPGDYIAFYPAIEDEPSFIRRLDRRYGLHKRCREVIRRVRERGRLLDVGCATGVFLDGMRRRGWTVAGVEPSESAARYARDRFGLDVFQGELEAAGYPSGVFDVVTLWDVLEHVFDPMATLSELARILKPGGWLVMSLPNPDCLEARIFGCCWAGWDVPRHLHVFSRAVLAQMLVRAGFELREVKSFTGRHGVLALNLEFCQRDRLGDAAARERFSRVVRSMPARLLTLPYYAIADRLNQSSVMTVFARKAT